MRAVVITSPGGPEVLKIQEVETPEPVGDQVRVRVRASGINRADLLQRAGAYPAPQGSPSNIPGLEFAGGATVCGTSRTPEKLERAKALGLDVGLSDKHFADEVKQITGGEGVHVIIDFVGAPYLEQNMDALAAWGRLVNISTMGGAQAS